MINKIFSYSRQGIPLKREGREVGCGRGGERKGEDGIRTVENRVRKRYGGKEGVKRK